MKAKVTVISWDPIRRGKIYCSPACGAKCTIFQYDKAWMAANKLIKRLGKNWEPVIHENMGWFASVKDSTGCWSISISEYYGKESYSVHLNAPNRPGGRWSASADSPEEAIEAVKAQARKEINELYKLLVTAKIDSEDLYNKV